MYQYYFFYLFIKSSLIYLVFNAAYYVFVYCAEQAPADRADIIVNVMTEDSTEFGHEWVYVLNKGHNHILILWGCPSTRSEGYILEDYISVGQLLSYLFLCNQLADSYENSIRSAPCSEN